MRPVSYVDPGTGGMVVSGIWGALAAACALVLGYVLGIFKRIKKAIGSVWKGKHS